ncbi:PREDICTED: E1A-binding protein p400-like isoform X3 [Gavialis gangeticus]|uniref:E1A-binding protein p400-like isoform X3 n=1 Tax=Gavialis gangeticus TaxID=94835 RepID=UPI00092EFA88|nr:PREDICTED: E1A-binding protein p400-like isoform X3 [Gavialis gangeticus]
MINTGVVDSKIFRGGMSPNLQTARLAEKKQSQQQTGETVTRLHSPLPRLCGRLQPPEVATAAHPVMLQVLQQPPAPQLECLDQPQICAEPQPQNVPLTLRSQVVTSLQHQVQPVGQAQRQRAPTQHQENQIHRRIADLRKVGLWSMRRLPKLQEASRPKSHQDYLLEEMQWMATDFAQERRWKVATARKLVRSVTQYHEDKKLWSERAKKEQQNRLRCIAACVAREIEYFWFSIKQVVELKLQVELEERRKNSLRGLNRRIKGPAIPGRKGEAITLLTDHKEMEESVSGRRSTREEVVLIDSFLGIDQCEGAIQKYMKDVSEFAAAAAAEVLLPKGSDQIATAVKCCAPSGQHGTLRDYQKLGLDWLVKLYEKNLNGVLADETGLGKTMQVAALFAYLACSGGNWGPHLVVAQNCNVLKWKNELERWCPELKVLLYFARQREFAEKRQEWMKLSNFNICITSYKQLFRSYQVFMKMQWKYLVIDERQKIKNLSEKHWEALCRLQSQHRLLLIEPPLPTSLIELWTLVHFLIPGISRPCMDFVTNAAKKENEDYYQKMAMRLHRITQPLIFQRTKRQVEKQLTKKYDHVLKCYFSHRQKAMYKDVLFQPRTQEALRSRHFVSVLHVLMQLQKICNHPDLINPRLSSSSYVLEPLDYTIPSLVLNALEWDLWKRTDMSLFDLIGMEDKMTRYAAQRLPNQEVTRKLIEEIYSSPPTPPRPNPVKLRPSKLFQPVLYGQKPEGRTLHFPTLQVYHTANTTMATAAHCGSKVEKLGWSFPVTGAQDRNAQPEMPVTLHFKGKTFTLSYSQLCQLTGGQPLQLEGNTFHIVSVSTLKYLGLQPHWPAALPSIGWSGSEPVESTSFTKHVDHHSNVSTSTVVTQQMNDSETKSKSMSLLGCPTQALTEEKNRLWKEHVDRILSGNEHRCSKAPVYGRDLLGICFLISERKTPWQYSASINKWRWAGFVNCCLSSRASEGLSNPLQDLVLVPGQRQESLKDVVNSTLCVLPAAVVARPANPPSYACSMKTLKHNLEEQVAPYFHQLQRITTLPLLQFPDRRLVQYDSGKLEALSVLLQKLKSEGHRVLILTQMTLMLDILEQFLNFHFLTYIRVEEYASCEQHMEQINAFNRDKRIFCAILSSHSPSAGVTCVEADAAVFYDVDLDPLMDAKAQEWCHRLERGRDIHVYRLVSSNSIEEMLLKNGTKHLIREVAASGNDNPMAFLTQALTTEQGKEDPRKYAQETRYELRVDITSELHNARNSVAPSQLKELVDFMDQLLPIEKYALNFLELCYASTDPEKQKANEDLKNAKIKWELHQIKELKGREEKIQCEEEEELLTYTRQDAYNMEYIYEGSDGQMETMPLWTPLTLPEDHDDTYIDSVLCLMYDRTPISESKLPPLYSRMKQERQQLDPSGKSKRHHHGKMAAPPPSLFSHVNLRLLEMRQKGKGERNKLLLRRRACFAKLLPAFIRSAAEAGQDSPEWQISEDRALLQAVKQLLQLPLNLAVVSPAQTPNWDLVSDVVNTCSQAYRSSKQCQNRFVNLVIAREEVKKMNGHLRTKQTPAQDPNSAHVQLYMSHFDLMTMAARKRSSPDKTLSNWDKPASITASPCMEPKAKVKKTLTENQMSKGADPQETQQQTIQQAQVHPPSWVQTQTCLPAFQLKALRQIQSAKAVHVPLADLSVVSVLATTGPSPGVATLPSPPESSSAEINDLLREPQKVPEAQIVDGEVQRCLNYTHQAAEQQSTIHSQIAQGEPIV